MDELAKLRQQMEKIDRDILGKIRERFAIATEMGKIKLQNDMPIVQPEREEQVLQQCVILASEFGLSSEMVTAIWKLLIAESRRVQEK